MTIWGWFIFIVFSIIIMCASLSIGDNADHAIIGAIIGLLLVAILFGGMWWYFNHTASGARALVDQKSELGNGLERTINIYTANGDIIASYTGKIDLEDNEGGYVLFDYEGRRYTYYNCFVESIANID